MTTKLPRSFVAWPSRGNFRELPTKLPRLSDLAKGPAIEELLDTLTDALREPVRIPAGSVEAFVAADHSPAFGEVVANLTAAMTGLLRCQIAPFEQPHFARDIDASTILKIAAAAALNSADPNKIDPLATAFSLLAGIQAESAPRPARGRMPVDDAASRLVAVVVAYHQKYGIAVRAGPHNWSKSRMKFADPNSPFSDDEVRPKSPTAELLVAVRNALNLQVSNRTLEGLLDTLIRKLHREGMRRAGPQDWPDLLWES